jgi:hypothetical protein
LLKKNDLEQKFKWATSGLNCLNRTGPIQTVQPVNWENRVKNRFDMGLRITPVGPTSSGVSARNRTDPNRCPPLVEIICRVWGLWFEVYVACYWLDGGHVKDGGSQTSVWWKHLHGGNWFDASMVIVVGNHENAFFGKICGWR